MRWIAENVSAIWAGLAAVGISSMMDVRDGQSAKFIATGAVACGIISMSLSGLMIPFGLPQNAASAVGGGIGFLGATRVRNILISITEYFIKRRSGGTAQQGEEQNGKQ